VQAGKSKWQIDFPRLRDQIAKETLRISRGEEAGLPTVGERLNLLEPNNAVLTLRVEEFSGQFQFISSQLASVQRYLHARFDKLEGRMDKFEGRMDRLEGEVAGLRRDLPSIVAETMREVLREQRSG
jgi:hypothetical protein